MARNNSNEAPKRVISVAGVVGTDIEVRDTDYGEVANFRLAVTTSYEEGAESKWFDISVWNEGLIASVEQELYKGAKVAVEGTYSVREYDGREYPKISAARVGLIEWLSRSKGNGGNRSSSRSRDEEEERPTRRGGSSRASSGSSRGKSSRPSRAEAEDTEGDDLPW